MIDPRSFHELAERDPETVCRRALCSYEAEKKSYTLTVWGDDYSIYPYECKIDRISNNLPAPCEIFDGFILHYLLQSKESRIYNEWISEKQIPIGDIFFSGIHEIPTHLISEKYGDNTDEFRKTCEQLQGIPLDIADAAYSFNITTRIPLAVVFWAGDGEFPARSRILYDKSITEHLALDVILALAVEVCSRIGNTWHPYQKS